MVTLAVGAVVGFQKVFPAMQRCVKTFFLLKHSEKNASLNMFAQTARTSHTRSLVRSVQN